MGGLNRGGECDEVIAIQYPGIKLLAYKASGMVCVCVVR